MNKTQLTDLVIIPTLKEIPYGYSKEAALAVQMIIAHESCGGDYIAQMTGPALGVIQMEPLTHDDVWMHGDSIRNNAALLGISQCVGQLVYDLRYNVFMARQKLFMAKGALPSDPAEMAKYLKLNWNGDGKATPEKYHQDYCNWC
jgi:hypothetical protein|tara:strand:+ start:1028 stop:1462 length:435 start_codon:yes stop_codon:yes gene_type:complete